LITIAPQNLRNQVQARYAYVPDASVPGGSLHIRRCLSSTATFCQ